MRSKTKPAKKAATKRPPVKRKSAAAKATTKVSRPAKKKSIKKKTIPAKTSPSIPVIKSIAEPSLTPFWNIVDAGNKFKIRVSAPGVDSKHIKVNTIGNYITISSVNEDSGEKKNKKYLVREYSYKSWSKSFTLPGKVNTADMKVKYKEGILKIDLPKA